MKTHLLKPTTDNLVVYLPDDLFEHRLEVSPPIISLLLRLMSSGTLFFRPAADPHCRLPPVSYVFHLDADCRDCEVNKRP